MPFVALHREIKERIDITRIENPREAEEISRENTYLSVLREVDSTMFSSSLFEPVTQ